MLRKIWRILLCTLLVGWIFARSHREYREEIVVEGAFSESSLEIFEKFEGQTLRVGYASKYKRDYLDFLVTVLEKELSIGIEFVFFNCYDNLEEAVLREEIHAFVGLEYRGDVEDLKHTEARFTNQEVIVTNIENPLENIVRLRDSRIGILAAYADYSGYLVLLEDERYAIYFFDTLDEGFNALEDQNIDVFITNERNGRALITREKLQIESVFRNEILNIQFITATDEIHQMIEAVNDHRYEFQERFLYHYMQTLVEEIKEYIQEKYQYIIERYEIVEVGIGMHNTSFPYSYFGPDGTPRGLYIEILDLFEYLTGIEYNIRNNRDDTDFANLLDELTNNDLQFVLGVPDDGVRESISRVGLIEVRDDIISIVEYGNRNVDGRNRMNMRIGAVSTLEVPVELLIGRYEYREFENYRVAIEALMGGEIDILLGRQSVLAYYYHVQGNAWLIQHDFVNMQSSHSVLGNSYNEGLNELMAEIQRLYHIMYIGDQETRWLNQTHEYERIRAREVEQQITRIMVGVGIPALVILGIYFILLKKGRKIKMQSQLDSLTGLYNRGSYKEKCMELINKNPDKLGLFVFIDLNDFKGINDTYGHATGDAVITQVGKILRSLSDENTIPFRIAGDEFGIFSIGFQDHHEIIQLVRRIKQSIYCEVELEDGEVLSVYYSAGCSIYNRDTTDFEILTHYADFAMYQAKRKKKDQLTGNIIELFDMDIYNEYREKKTRSMALDAVLREEQIYAVYQPVCCLETGDIYGYEGLSRSSHSKFPDIFELIKAADMEGRLQELDLLMMERVIRNFNGEGKLFVNVAGKSDEELIEYIEKVVQITKDVGLSLEDIVLELSERKEWSQTSLRIIQKAIKKYRFLLAIDDFGVNFSNISLILALQPDIIKIDKSIVHEIHKDAKRYTYMKSFLEFSKGNSMKIVCEGIEVIEEFEVLKRLGSDYGQGYYLGRPE